MPKFRCFWVPIECEITDNLEDLRSRLLTANLTWSEPYNELERPPAVFALSRVGCGKNAAKIPMDSSGRVLALDFGKRRIGLAISDEMGLTAQGLETLQRTTIREDLARIAALAAENSVSLILLSDPIRLNGRPGEQSEQAREFGQRLTARSGITVKLWDERFTTVQAQRVLKESGISSRKRAQAVDRLAAVILLESYLDWRSFNEEDNTQSS
jgi:putative pre-16S rRNA nuclease